jgi:hypothetical protein
MLQSWPHPPAGKEIPVHRLLSALALGLLATAVSATASAGDVYQWKNAQGVTQYSSLPPPTGTFKVRSIRNDGSAQIADVSTKAAENPSCAIARKNMELLQGKAAIQIDSNGDGKPDKTLSDDDRANQMQLAQATLKVNCAAAAVAEVVAPGK